MRLFFCFLATFCFSINGFSQIELPTRTLKISPIKKPDAPPKPTPEIATPAIIKYESSIEKSVDDKLLKGFTLLPKKEEKGIMEKEPIRSIAEVHTKKQNDKLKSEGISQEIVNSDTFLGEFTVYTAELTTKCRDYSAIDGDNVRIWLNDEIIVTSVYLESTFKTYTLNLKEGLNIIKIQALNIGESFPNTGQFIFFDGNGKLVTNQNWGLNAGYFAIIRILKKEGIPITEK